MAAAVVPGIPASIFIIIFIRIHIILLIMIELFSPFPKNDREPPDQILESVGQKTMKTMNNIKASLGKKTIGIKLK